MSRQEEKDAELDRRIVALRKKNQALLRRYQVCGLCQAGGPTGLALLGFACRLRHGGLSLQAWAGTRVRVGVFHLRGSAGVLGTL